MNFLTAQLLLFPFETLIPYGVAENLVGASQITFNDESYPIYCYDQTLICMGLYHLLPAVDLDMAWPVPYIYRALGIGRFYTLE